MPSKPRPRPRAALVLDSAQAGESQRAIVDLAERRPPAEVSSERLGHKEATSQPHSPARRPQFVPARIQKFSKGADLHIQKILQPGVSILELAALLQAVHRDIGVARRRSSRSYAVAVVVHIFVFVVAGVTWCTCRCRLPESTEALPV